jgi:hypothetical protein
MAPLNVEPLFDTVRSDPRIAALVDRVGLPNDRRMLTAARTPDAGPFAKPIACHRWETSR